MARPRGNWTLDSQTISYLKQFPNQSKIIDEAVELHRNKDKIIFKTPDIPKGQLVRVIG